MTEERVIRFGEANSLFMWGEYLRGDFPLLSVISGKSNLTLVTDVIFSLSDALLHDSSLLLFIRKRLRGLSDVSRLYVRVEVGV